MPIPLRTFDIYTTFFRKILDIKVDRTPPAHAQSHAIVTCSMDGPRIRVPIVKKKLKMTKILNSKKLWDMFRECLLVMQNQEP